MSPAGQQFVIQSSYTKLDFTFAIVIGYLHLVKGSDKLQYSKAPVLDDIGGLVRAGFFIISR